MLLKSLHCLMKEFLHFFITFSYNFDIWLKSIKKSITPQQRPSVPCILQILTTFNLYSGRPRVGLSVNNKQKVRQAVVKISRREVATLPPLPPPPPLARYVSRNGLIIGGLAKLGANSLFLPSPYSVKFRQNIFGQIYLRIN